MSHHSMPCLSLPCSFLTLELGIQSGMMNRFFAEDPDEKLQMLLGRQLLAGGSASRPRAARVSRHEYENGSAA